jgi:hypothetical protein
MSILGGGILPSEGKNALHIPKSCPVDSSEQNVPFLLRLVVILVLLLAVK